MIKLPKIPKLPTFELPALPAGLPGIPKTLKPALLGQHEYQKHLEKMRSFREANKVFFDEDVCAGDLFVIRNNNKAFKHLVISVENVEKEPSALTWDRVIKVFSFSRNCIVKFYRGAAYQDIWSGSFSEHDINYNYNYAYLPVEINKVF